VQTVASFLMRRQLHLPAPEERLVEVAPAFRCYVTAIGKRIEPVRSRSLWFMVGGVERFAICARHCRQRTARGMNVIRYNQRNCGGRRR